MLSSLSPYYTAGPTHSVMARRICSLVRLVRGWKYSNLVKMALILMGLLQAFENISIFYGFLSRPGAGGSGPELKTRVHVTWSYTYDIPHEGLGNMKDLAKLLPNAEFRFYCGSAKCVETVRGLEKQSFVPVRIRIQDFQRGTPLDSWFRHHALNKVIAGPYFKRDFQDAIRLYLLWLYGDLHVEPYLYRMSKEGTVTTVSLPKQGCVITSTRYQMLLCQSEASSNLTLHAIEEFLLLYNRSIDTHRTVTPEPFKIHRELRLRVQHRLIPLIFEEEQRNQGTEYGILSFAKYVELGHGNIGDQMQSLATAHFIPHVDHFVDREDPTKVPKTNCTLLGNAFWHRKTILNTVIPFIANVNLIPVGVHLDKAETWNVRSVFKKYGLVGARGTVTLKVLKNNNIPAIFSGCLTLFIQNPHPDRQRSDYVFIVDVYEENLLLLPPHILKNAISIPYPRPKNPTIQNNFKWAASLVESYARAKVVITHRLHVALPCVALGTPVIFINSGRATSCHA